MTDDRRELAYVPTERASRPDGSVPARDSARATPDNAYRVDADVARVGLHPGSTLLDGRFAIVRLIGRGGMGVVYEALDAERRGSVALKTLQMADPRAIYRFKNEFRALADVHHPNLVQLYELFCDAEHWFFTMELVCGDRFDLWVRPLRDLDLVRLRSALAQLVEGVAAIHRAGQLHRDLKPTNVLVTPDGRVVALDFGLVAEPEGGTGQTIGEVSLLGTPAYMSPEQAAGLPATQASDFYAIGVMLFEVLTGKLPFDGNLGEILAAKQRDVPPLPVARDAPACPDLEELCSELLSRVPGRRPQAASVLERLSSNPLPWVPSSRPPQSSKRDDPWRPVGREVELAELRDAYRSTTAGQAVFVSVAGESGIGKTALCQAFLDEIRSEDVALVLAGRCYEQESIPYKVLDPLVDELSRQLRRLPHEYAASLLPRDAFALAKLFPALDRVDVIAQAPARSVPNAQELQRRAWAALHELFARIRARQPLVIHLDDLQWADADSAKVLRYLFIRRTPPVPLLLIASFRTVDAEQNPSLTSVLRAASSNRMLQVRALQLGPLAAADTERLARRLLGDEANVQHWCSAITQHSCGSPFFATELARFARNLAGTGDDSLSLGALLAARIADLPGESRRVLEVLAVAGRPLRAQVALDAAHAHYKDIDHLKAVHLLRGSESSRQKWIDCYHDQIREHVRANLSEPDRHACWSNLAAALSGRADSDPELLSRCLEGAGDFAGAARSLVSAAKRAFEAFAFDQAAALYRRALNIAPHPMEDARELTEQLGHALEYAGRCAEAAAAYEHAAALCTGEPSLDLRRRAAEELFATGQFEQGSAALAAVCSDLGLKFPFKAGSALAWRLRSRVHLQFRQLLRPRAADEISSLDALRLRTARTLVTGFLGYLPIQAAICAARYVDMAFATGDRSHQLRALGYAAYVQTLNNPSGKPAASLLASMDELARDGGPELTGFTSLIHGCAAFHLDACPQASAHLARARQDLRASSGVRWELDWTHIYAQLSALYCGKYAEIVQTTPTLIEEAFRRGRLFAGAMLSGFAGMFAWINVDDPAGYRVQLQEAKRYWRPGPELRWPDYFMLAGEAMLAAYEGEPARAFDLLAAHYDAYRSSKLTSGPGIGAANFFARLGRCAASALQLERVRGDWVQRRHWRRAIQDSVHTVRRQNTAKALGVAHTLQAALAFDAGSQERAASELTRAIALLDEAGTSMSAAAARRRLGQLLGGEQGRALIAAGSGYMQSQGVRDIEAITELDCAGCVSS